jgi:uncharacterized protein (DUF1015 family)
LAEITAFQGIRYNQDIIKDMASVISPPYDIISPQDQKQLYERSEYNIIRVEHGMEMPDDTKINNKYTRARDTFNHWITDDILKVDSSPTFYIHEHGFMFRGTPRKRLGLITCVRLEPWARKVILPHEHTLSKDKTDRLELMKACGSNISPIMGLFDDPGNKVTKLIMDKMMPSKMLISITSGDETHRVWKANEPEFTQRISHFMIPKSIYIADGHHRYETALVYQEEQRKISSSQSGMEAYNYMLMTLISFSDPGLIMMPVHRLIKGLSAQEISGIKQKLSEYFEMENVPVTNADLVEYRGSEIRVVGLEPGNIIVLKPKAAALNAAMPAGHHDLYKKLDVSIMENVILEKVLGMDAKTDKISYSPDAVSAYQMVSSGTFQIAFLLNNLPVTMIKSLADVGERMPRKSTYFFPKLPTGLVISRLQGRL